jgi:hypothetical protein
MLPQSSGPKSMKRRQAEGKVTLFFLGLLFLAEERSNSSNELSKKFLLDYMALVTRK